MEALSLQLFDQRQLSRVDGTVELVPYVGPVHIQYEGNMGFTGAIVHADEVILGTIPMDEMQPRRARPFSISS